MRPTEEGTAAIQRSVGLQKEIQHFFVLDEDHTRYYVCYGLRIVDRVLAYKFFISWVLQLVQGRIFSKGLYNSDLHRYSTM